MRDTKEIELDNSQVENLVDWANPPTLRDLKKDVEEALSDHNRQVSLVNQWISTLRGETKFKTMEGRSKVQPKLVRKQSEWRYAALEEPFLSTEDMFKVNPATYDDVESARQNQLILNKQFRVDIPKVKFINKFVRYAVNQGTVIVKLAWETRIGVVTEEMPVYAETPEEAMQYLQNAIQTGQMAPEDAQMMLQSGQPIQIGLEPQEVEKEVVNRPVLQVRDVRNVIIDPSCEGDLDNAQFIVDRFLTDLSSLKQDGRYSNLDQIQDSDFNSGADDLYYQSDWKKDVGSFRFSDKARKKLIAHEYWGYWDIDGEGITKPIVATWVGNTLIRLEENPYPDKKPPFVLAQYLPPDWETVYGEADAALLKDNQDIIGAVTRAMIDLIGRSANAQQGVRKDLLDPINRKKFNQGLDFEYNPVANLGDALYTTKIPEIPKSALEVITLQNNEAEALTGIKAFTGGITGTALGDNVGGIRSALDATAKRELGILRRLSDALKEIGRKIIAMNSEWLSDEEIIRVTDEEFVAIKRSDLAGNFDISLDISTAEQDNTKASELAFLLQTTGNNLPFDITKIILSKIADLRKLPDLAKTFMEYQPQPDPIQQERAQLENEMLGAQIFNEKAKGAENQVDVRLKDAKTQTELAKARSLHSSADQQDLDYIEQASGLTQERELEKQAIGQQYKAEAEKAKAQAEIEKIGAETEKVRAETSKSNADAKKAMTVAEAQIKKAKSIPPAGTKPNTNKPSPKKSRSK